MTRKTILFWAVWVLAAPLILFVYCLSWRGSLRAQWQYWRSGLALTKTSLVRQAIYQRLVREKAIQRHLYNLYRKRRF